MDKEQQESVRVAVQEILVEADMKEVSEKQVRELASKKTGIDLSASRESRKFVFNEIKKVLESRNEVLDAEGDDERKASPDDDRRKSSKKMKAMETEETEEVKDDEDDEDRDDEDDEEGGGVKKRKYESDGEGNIIICELSAKRKVVVSQWRGRTLINVREYYEKDGKVLPTSKGISLTSEQFQVLANSVKDVDGAISSLE